MTEEERQEFLSIREEAGRQIDPATAEVDWEYGLTSDPYWVKDLPAEERQGGRNYFARSPGSDIWVSFHDLPKATCDALWEKHPGLGLPLQLEFADDADPLFLRPYVHAAVKRLHDCLWGKIRDNPERELADLTPIEIYNYVAADLSRQLNRPAPLQEVACVILVAWMVNQYLYNLARKKEKTLADRENRPILLRLDETCLMIETEAGASMPAEYRFSTFHSPNDLLATSVE